MINYLFALKGKIPRRASGNAISSMCNLESGGPACYLLKDTQAISDLRSLLLFDFVSFIIKSSCLLPCFTD